MSAPQSLTKVPHFAVCPAANWYAIHTNIFWRNSKYYNVNYEANPAFRCHDELFVPNTDPSISYKIDMTAFLTFDIELGEVIDLGITPLGRRRMVPLLTGKAEGAFAGRLLPGGTDWQVVQPGGTLEINARYIFETPAGERIEVQSSGLRACDSETLARFDRGESVPPEAYYFRTAVRLFTGASGLLHLNDRLYVCEGQRLPKAVRLLINPVP